MKMEETTVTGKDYFKEYRVLGGKLPRETFYKYLGKFNEQVAKELLIGNEVRLTYFGRLRIEKIKLKRRYLNPVRGGKPQVNVLNSDNFQAKVRWVRRGCLIKGRTCFRFRLTTANRINLREIMRGDINHKRFLHRLTI